MCSSTKIVQIMPVESKLVLTCGGGMHLFYICGPSRKKGPSGRNFQSSSLQFRKQERFLIKTMYELVCIQSYLWLPFAISGGKKQNLRGVAQF